MADAVEKKYLDLVGIEHLVDKLDTRENTKDAAVLQSAKDYADGLADNYDPAGTAETKVNALANGQVKTNTDAIAKLDGDVTVDGSVKKQIADAKTELEGKITASAYDDTALKGRVTANEQAIATLNGEGAGSVKKQIDDAFNDFATKVSDDNVVNTFKELVDYCATHSSEAAEMAGDIQANATAIANLEKFIGTLPEGTSAATVIDYINAKVVAVDFSDAIATAKSEAIAAAATDATSKANQVLADAKSYADGLAPNYATAAQGAKADTAVQKVITGTANGTISVDGTDVPVKGLGSAAYEAKTSFEVAGAAQALADGQVTTNKNNITALTTRVETLEGTSYVAITTTEIDNLFA